MSSFVNKVGAALAWLTKNSKYAKAIYAAALPTVTIVYSAISDGEIDATEQKAIISSVIAAVLVFLVPNKKVAP